MHELNNTHIGLQERFPKRSSAASVHAYGNGNDRASDRSKVATAFGRVHDMTNHVGHDVDWTPFNAFGNENAVAIKIHLRRSDDAALDPQTGTGKTILCLPANDLPSAFIANNGWYRATLVVQKVDRLVAADD